MSIAVFVGILLVLLAIGEPLYLLLGGSAVLCFILFSHIGLHDMASSLLERIRSLADQQILLAIPFFMLAGAIMSAGDISKRLIRFARALLGWLPGGLAVSGVGACLLFASITGSSTATLVAIGGLVCPALVAERYRENFSIGLVTTAGSIGILVPPSIPMIIYCLFNTSTKVEIEKMWLGGVGPALLIATCLGAYSMFIAVKEKIPRYKFSLRELGAATRDGFWSLMLPALILGGIYSGVFTAIEAAACSVVYSVLVEVYFHGGLTWRDMPKLFADTVMLVGSFIVVVVMAMGLSQFFTDEGIPERCTHWITGMHLTPFWFLLAVDLLLLIIGCLMDIMSALMVFVPLVAPMAAAIGIDPIHLGVVFIINLEIGFLTPPIGLNLFLSASLFKKSFGQVMRYTAPFVLLMLGCVAATTWIPKVSLFLVEWVYDYVPVTPESVRKRALETGTPKDTPRVKSMKEMMDEGDSAPPATSPPVGSGVSDADPNPSDTNDWLFIGTANGILQISGDGTIVRTVTSTPARRPRFVSGTRNLLFLNPEETELRMVSLVDGSEKIAAKMPESFLSCGEMADFPPGHRFKIEELSIQSEGDFIVRNGAACLVFQDRNDNMMNFQAAVRVTLATGMVEKFVSDCGGKDAWSACSDIGSRQVRPHAKPTLALPFRIEEGKLIEDAADGKRSRKIDAAIHEEEESPSGRWVIASALTEQQGDYVYRRLLLLDRQYGKFYALRSGTWPSPLGSSQIENLERLGDKTETAVGEDPLRWLTGDRLRAKDLLITPGQGAIVIEGDLAE